MEGDFAVKTCRHRDSNLALHILRRWAKLLALFFRLFQCPVVGCMYRYLAVNFLGPGAIQTCLTQYFVSIQTPEFHSLDYSTALPVPAWPTSSLCSRTFNTGLGLLLVPYSWAHSSSQYSWGASSGCYSHSFSHRQAYSEPLHPERVGAHSIAYNPTLPGPPKIFACLQNKDDNELFTKVCEPRRHLDLSLGPFREDVFFFLLSYSWLDRSKKADLLVWDDDEEGNPSLSLVFEQNEREREIQCEGLLQVTRKWNQDSMRG